MTKETKNDQQGGGGGQALIKRTKTVRQLISEMENHTQTNCTCQVCLGKQDDTQYGKFEPLFIPHTPKILPPQPAGGRACNFCCEFFIFCFILFFLVMLITLMNGKFL